MPFPVWCEIVCVECSDVISGAWTDEGVPRRVLKAEALHAKATHNRDTGEWKCRYCQAPHPMYEPDDDEDLDGRFKVIWKYGPP